MKTVKSVTGLFVTCFLIILLTFQSFAGGTIDGHLDMDEWENTARSTLNTNNNSDHAVTGASVRWKLDSTGKKLSFFFQYSQTLSEQTGHGVYIKIDTGSGLYEYLLCYNVNDSIVDSETMIDFATRRVQNSVEFEYCIEAEIVFPKKLSLKTLTANIRVADAYSRFTPTTTVDLRVGIVPATQPSTKKETTTKTANQNNTKNSQKTTAPKGDKNTQPLPERKATTTQNNVLDKNGELYQTRRFFQGAKEALQTDENGSAIQQDDGKADTDGNSLSSGSVTPKTVAGATFGVLLFTTALAFVGFVLKGKSITDVFKKKTNVKTSNNDELIQTEKTHNKEE